MSVKNSPVQHDVLDNTHSSFGHVVGIVPAEHHTTSEGDGPLSAALHQIGHVTEKKTTIAFSTSSHNISESTQVSWTVVGRG